MIRAFFSILLILVSTYTPFTFAGSIPHAPIKMRLMLDWFINPNHGPIIVAKQLGWFKKAGLDLTILQPSDPNLPAKLVATNQIDMAISYPSTLLASVTHQLPLMCSGNLISTPLNALMTLSPSNIQDLADLKGKTIGIAVSSSGNAALKAMLNSVNIKLSQVKLINVGWSLVPALITHRVDAIWGGLRNYEYIELKQMGLSIKTFYPEAHSVPTYPALIFVVNKTHHNTQAIRLFNQVIAKASLFIAQYPKQAWQDFIAYDPSALNTPLNKASWFATAPLFAKDPSILNHQRYQTYAEFLYQMGVISTLPQTTTYLLSH